MGCATAPKEPPPTAPVTAKMEHPSTAIDDPEELWKKGEEAYQQRQDADAYAYWNRLITIFSKANKTNGLGLPIRYFKETVIAADASNDIE